MGNSKIFDYSTTPGSNTAAPPDGAPEGMAANSYNNTIREMMANDALFLRDLPWLDIFRAYTVSKVDAATARIAGVDVTAYCTAGRRIKITGASTVYGWVLSSTFTGGNTDITVAGDDTAAVPASVTKIEISVNTLLTIPDHVQSNPCCNPEFQVWRTGLTFTSSTTLKNNDGEYTADQTILLSDGNNIVEVSQELPTVPTGSQSSLRAKIVTGNKKFGFMEIFEAATSIPYRSKAVSFQFKLAITGTSIGAIRAGILLSTATADSPTIDPISAWAAAGTNPTLTGWTYAATPAALAAPSTSFQTYKIENLPIGASVNNLAWFIWVDDTTLTANDNLYIGQLQLDLGPRCLPYRPRSISETHMMCHRFLRTSFRDNVTPDDGATDTGSLSVTAPTEASPVFDVRFWPPMRTTPSVAAIAPSGGTAGQIKRVDGDAASLAATRVLHTSENSVRIDNTNTAGGINGRFAVHYLADARI